MAVRASARLHVYITLTVLLIAVTAAMSFSFSVRQQQVFEAAYRDHVLGTAQLADAMDALWKLRYGFPQYMVLDAEARERIVAEEPKWYDVIERNLQAYGGSPSRSPIERRELAELQAVYRRYIAARPRWFELYGAGKLDEAAAWRARTTTPYGAELVAAFERQISLQQDVAQTTLEKVRRNALVANGLLAALLALLLGMALAAWLEGVKIVGAMRRLRQRSDSAMAELFAGEGVDASRDELRGVIASFDFLRARFGDRVREQHAVLQRLEARNREFRLFHELGEHLQACQSIEEAEAAVHMHGPRLFPEHMGALYVYRHSRNLLSRSAVWGAEAASFRESFEPVACWALRSGKPHFVAVPDEMACDHAGGGTTGTLCVPMMAQGEQIGLLHLRLDPASTDPAASTMLQQTASSAATQLAIALANLHLREALRQQAVRDPLTGLYNRRFMSESLERDVARALRNQHPVALAMFDADHFKKFNDTFGHEAGDVVLQAIGAVLKNQLRGSDVACRYGGEEFIIVMPEAALAVARERAEAIRLAVSEMTLAREGKPLGRVTVSIGLAVLPEHGRTPATLIAAADAAMYAAKQAGRNRVVVAGEVAEAA